MHFDSHGHFLEKPFQLIKQAGAILDVYKNLSVEGTYQRYLDHYRSTHPDLEPLTFEQFYKAEQDRKWNSGGIMACC